jgi:hypothetical protein
VREQYLPAKAIFKHHYTKYAPKISGVINTFATLKNVVVRSTLILSAFRWIVFIEQLYFVAS